MKIMDLKDSKVLMVSLEKGLLKPGNLARNRILEYGKLVKQMTIIVFAREPYEETAENIHIISTNSSKPVFYVQDALLSAWKLRKKNFDLVVTQDAAEAGLVGWIASKFCHAKLAVQDVSHMFHGTAFRQENLHNRIRYMFGCWLVKRAQAVRTMAQRTVKELIKLGVPAEKIFAFPFAVDPQFARKDLPIPDSFKEFEHRKIFLMPVRFVPYKRIDLAIKAFAKVHALHPEALLAIIGKGPLEEKIRSWIKEQGLDESSVKIISWTQELTSWYRVSTAMLLTSDQEGYGMTVIESLMCGTPVIMTDVGCAGEVVLDGVNGYVVPSGDEKALAEKMLRIIDDPDSIRERVSKFVWNQPSVGMRDFFEGALNL